MFRNPLATQARLAPDAEAPLERAIFFAVAYSCPHEPDADEHERQRKQHDENHDRDALHPLSLPVRVRRRRDEAP
jgi:hypothetical protein